MKHDHTRLTAVSIVCVAITLAGCGGGGYLKPATNQVAERPIEAVRPRQAERQRRVRQRSLLPWYASHFGKSVSNLLLKALYARVAKYF